MRRAAAAFLLMAFGLAAEELGGFVKIPPGRNGSLSVDGELWMGRTEVSVAQFEKFVKTTGYQTAAEKAGAPRTWRQPGFPVSPKQPVVYVTPSDAQAYCAWVGGRLPTDAEWEYAARAGTSTRHYWGEAIDGRYLWFRENSDGRPRDIGTKRPNAFGLHDVEGNVWEWTMMEGQKELTARRRGASWVSCEDIDGGPGRAPSPLIGLSVGYGIPVKSDHRYDDIGFRCAKVGR
ncbi:MAG TPA: formylglycine-generating enzyme family protein [Bryobacteraceae bacterium]|mgnify:CR=1 FL=1|nr:formylglycine-generating enzyme family protein [Bryobacteraceae bacterium]